MPDEGTPRFGAQWSTDPDDWTVVHRPGDRERVGYLAPLPSSGAALVQPLTLLGTPVGEPAPPSVATERLIATGLAALARRWWCQLPAPLPAAGVDLHATDPDWPWRNVVVVEVTSQRCTIRPEWPAPEERTQTVTLPIPVGDLLTDDAG